MSIEKPTHEGTKIKQRGSMEGGRGERKELVVRAGGVNGGESGLWWHLVE